MVDPISIGMAVVGLADICTRIISWTKHLEEKSKEIREDVRTLKSELLSLQKVLISINELSQKTITKANSESLQVLGDIATWWEAISHTCLVGQDGDRQGALLKDKPTAMDILKDKLEDKLDRIGMAYRKKLKEGVFTELRWSLTNHQNSLQISFTALNLLVPILVRASADGLVATADLNEHFKIRETVSINYIGRKQLLEDLSKSYFKECETQKQSCRLMCFIVYGLGGSGKTEFCCKFAKENRKHFWGVFYVDASSEDRIKESFAKIAKLDNREGDIDSAKDWLSCLNLPWLLLIDNADDSELEIQRYIPSGKRGLVLITTRDPTLRKLGTFGAKHYHFERMELEEAHELLMEESGQERPWVASVQENARQIAEALGCLPLALVYAGKAILKGACTLAEYISYYKEIKRNIWQARRRQGKNTDYNTSDMDVYSSYDILFQKMEDVVNDAKIGEAVRDAIDLLRIFSFFYYENLSVEILFEAAKNPIRESEMQKHSASDWSLKSALKPNISRQALRAFMFMLQQTIFEDRGAPNLPCLLRSLELGSLSEQGFKVRLDAALSELSQRSLIICRSDSNATYKTYSMHPLVHEWVRQRPQMTTGDQAIRCQEAITVLSRSIVLPLLAGGPERERLHSELLPHIRFVQNREKDITAEYKDAQSKRSVWRNIVSTPLGKRIGRKEAAVNGKFGFVYLQCGHYSKAAEHFHVVRDFLLPLGLENEISRVNTLALATSYLLMGATTESSSLQREALFVCKKSLGHDHIDTIKLMDTYALTLSIQGRYPEALELQNLAISKFLNIEKAGSHHLDALSVMNHKGETLWKLFRWDEAINLHQSALTAFQKEPPDGFGQNDVRTLEVKYRIAVAYLEMGRSERNNKYFEKANFMLEEVFEKRQTLLGREHPWTLVAGGGLAQAKSELGDFATAEALFKKHIAISDRTLGENHLGAIGHGRFRLAQCYLRHKKYATAEAMFLDVLRRHAIETARLKETTDEIPRGNHPDLIYYKYYLLDCYRQQGKIGEAFSLCHSLLTALQESPHPIKQWVVHVHEKLCAITYPTAEA
ncbi:hypothetical protein B0O99DRAFT_685796 [Bisporella sp. PMI_857]|nr:hypothetical protein B0O99DRAFT_685796 [Bisporella sp. PMI_857]